jgi:hypothetical protein
VKRNRKVEGQHGKHWFDQNGARWYFWENVRLLRPRCVEALRSCVLPTWQELEDAEGAIYSAPPITMSEDVSDDARPPTLEEANAPIERVEQAKLSFSEAITDWGGRWNLRASWLRQWVELTVEEMTWGTGTVVPESPPHLLLELPGLLENTTGLSFFRKRAPAELRFRFEDWWYLPLGETVQTAKNRIGSAFQERLKSYLLDVERVLVDERKTVEAFQPEHFMWLVRRIVPNRETCHHIAVTAHSTKTNPRIGDYGGIGIRESSVSDETKRLADFLGDIDFAPRPSPTLSH